MGEERMDKRVMAIGMEVERDGYPLWWEGWSGSVDGLVQEVSG